MKKTRSHYKTQVAFDVECYINYFLACFKTQDGKQFHVAMLDDKIIAGDKDQLKTILNKHRLISFNGMGYDMPIIAAFLMGKTNAEMRKISDMVILKNIPYWKLPVRIPRVDHIDLIRVTPLHATLKEYGSRIHSPKLQDLPIDPKATITQATHEQLLSYCWNDVDVTLQIFDTMAEDIKLRAVMGREYGMDLRSKSGPQIAEAVLRSKLQAAEHEVTKREDPVEPFNYEDPGFLKFNSPALQEIYNKALSVKFDINEHGHVELPDELGQVIPFAGANYKLGIGGLHSQEANQAVIAGDKELFELDVASMYPSIILGQQLHPSHLHEDFCKIYKVIYDTRIAAKHSGDKVTADSLKLVMNSSFGKFGSKYSFLYDPHLVVQTTLTGQFALLMLIERLDAIGAKVVSANTDGVVVHTDVDVSDVWHQWEKDTSMTLEKTPYQAIYSESVNSYIAIKAGGGTKCKGAYAAGGIGKGYADQICIDAVCEYLEHDTPIEDTIHNCTDIRKFLTMRRVKGGAKWRGEPLGKVVRWYKSTDGESIHYISNDNKVATSDNAVPMMNLVEGIPDDLNYSIYINKANEMLGRLGL